MGRMLQIIRPIFSIRSLKKSLSIQPIKVGSKYDFLKWRVMFLGLEADIELLEMATGMGIWIIFFDIAGLIVKHQENIIYSLVFKIFPCFMWPLFAFAVGSTHLVSVLLDRSYDPKVVDPSLAYLKIRYRCMFLAFVFLLAITTSVFVSHSYALVWKYTARDTVFAVVSFLRLRYQYVKLRKKQREKYEPDSFSNSAGGSS